MTGTIVVTEASGAQPAASGQATQQAQTSNQTQAPKVAQMPKTGVGTMALASRNTELVLLMVLAAVGLGAGALVIRRRA